MKLPECSLAALVCIVKEVGCDGCKMKPNDTVQGLVSGPRSAWPAGHPDTARTLWDF